MQQTLEALAERRRALADRRRAPGRRSTVWWVFGSLAALLVARNWHLFTTPMYEEGDAAANSILVDNAKHFTQLVGNYSRVGFHHPGPAFLQVQAAGEWLFHDVLGVVPSEWNGQALGILLLNAALVALSVSIITRWFADPAAPGRVEVAVAATAVIFLGSWYDLVTSTWPPFEYFAPYLLLLAAGASVAAGGVRDLWALALAAGLLVHGHAEFLFLASVLSAAAVVALAWPYRRALGGFVRANRVHAFRAAAVVALFALPIVANLVLHWPGEFGRYFGYGGENSAHPVGPALWYVIKVWDANEQLAAPVLLGCVLAMVLAVRVSQQPYARWALRLGGLALATVAFYTVIGIDDLGGVPYILFFTRALPLFALLVTVAVTIRYARGARAFAAALAGGAVVLGLFSPALVNRQVTVDDVPVALASIPTDRPVVLRLGTPYSWAEALPLAVEGSRHGARFCFTEDYVEIMVTPGFMCTPDEVSSGLTLIVARSGDEPAGGGVRVKAGPVEHLARLRGRARPDPRRGRGFRGSPGRGPGRRSNG